MEAELDANSPGCEEILAKAVAFYTVSKTRSQNDIYFEFLVIVRVRHFSALAIVIGNVSFLAYIYSTLLCASGYYSSTSGKLLCVANVVLCTDIKNFLRHIGKNVDVKQDSYQVTDSTSRQTAEVPADLCESYW